MQAFRYQIAQAYWKNKDWDNIRKWLNKIIEIDSDRDGFYKDLAKRRLLKVEYLSLTTDLALSVIMRCSFFLLIIFSFAIASNISLAGDYKFKRSGRTGYLKKDRFDSDHINIYDRSGSRKGYMKQDRFLKDRTYYYDKDGKREGYGIYLPPVPFQTIISPLVHMAECPDIPKGVFVVDVSSQLSVSG